MSSGERALHLTTPDDEAIRTCHLLLRFGDFRGVRDIINTNKVVISERLDTFEKAAAISDVLSAAETPLPNGATDWYGMIRMKQPGPIVSEDFEKLMNLLNSSNNPFPFCQEARVKASLAWSFLSDPTSKAKYDNSISSVENLVIEEDQSGDITDGGRVCGEGSEGEVDTRKRKAESLIFSDLPALENLKEFQETEESPLPVEEKNNEVPSKDTSFVPEKRNVGPGPDDEVVVISDDEDEEYVGRDIISMARTAKVRIVDGRKVKFIPLRKRQK
ncbi:hypothetical protein AtEden1_Chr4g0286401 [Arabidopsis thaliana]